MNPVGPSAPCTFLTTYWAHFALIGVLWSEMTQEVHVQHCLAKLPSKSRVSQRWHQEPQPLLSHLLLRCHHTREGEAQASAEHRSATSHNIQPFAGSSPRRPTGIAPTFASNQSHTACTPLSPKLLSPLWDAVSQVFAADLFRSSCERVLSADWAIVYEAFLISFSSLLVCYCFCCKQLGQLRHRLGWGHLPRLSEEIVLNLGWCSGCQPRTISNDAWYAKATTALLS